MRVKVFCPYCDQKTYEDESWAFGEVHQDGYLKCRCKLGHETLLGIEEPRFVLLFDIGARAYLDGYYREAVSTMNTAIERACEFFLEVVSEARGGASRLGPLTGSGER